MICKDRDGCNLWYMRRAFQFDYSCESVWSFIGLHWFVRAVFVVSGWIPRAVFIAATTDVYFWGLRRQK